MPASQANRYCSHLEIPIPRVEDFVGKRGVKLFHLMVVAILEHGEPLSFEAVAARLTAAGASAPTGDMMYSLKKAWHGMEPVYRDSSGRMGLNLSGYPLRSLLSTLNLNQSRVEPVAAPPEPEPVPDDVPLTEAELGWAFRGHSCSNESSIRLAAAILDARGEPMTVEDLDVYARKLTSFGLWLEKLTQRTWDEAGVRVGADGRLSIDRSALRIPAMRRAIRKIARPSQEAAARQEKWRLTQQVRQPELARQREEAAQAAARLRRAVLRVVPDQRPIAAAALVDVGEHTVRSFVGGELFELGAALESFDLVAALWVLPRDDIQAIRPAAERDR